MTKRKQQFVNHAILAAALVLCSRPLLFGQDGADEKKELPPIGAYVTVTSPIEDATFMTVTKAARDLQHQAEQENRRAVLILQITPGTSRFHQVDGLASELISARHSRVTTVAWIPETVTGHNVILALACNEIVMHPDAELGDIGRGRELTLKQQQDVVGVVEGNRNSKVNRSLAQGMLDRHVTVLRVTVQVDPRENGPTENRVVTSAELQRFRENGMAVFDVKTVKDEGEIGQLSGHRARELDVLVSHIAESRGEIADLYGLPREALRENATVGGVRDVRLIQIRGVIEPVLESFLARQINRCVAEGANLIIFEIDSPGGYLVTSINLAELISKLDPAEVRTVAYIPREAISGAAIIALGCDEIIMHPDAKIGDAGPIEIGEGGQFERAPEKILSFLTESLRTLADRKERPAALAEAMADRNLEVFEVTHRETARVWYMSDAEIHASDGEWTKGRLVPESKPDRLLTVNGVRAHELKLGEEPVADLDDLKQRLGIPADMQLVAVEKTWVDSLVFWLHTEVATVLLFVLAIFCIYLELYTMTGLFGIGSALFFTLFFWSRFLGGTAGWLEVVLFALGLVLILIEIFIIPGFGVFGVSGGLLLLASLVMASQTFGDWGPRSDFEIMTGTMGRLATSVFSVVILAIVMSRFLPQMPVLKQMILAPPGHGHEDEPQLRPGLSGSSAGSYFSDRSDLVGKSGIAVSMLRPAGKARVGEELIDVVSNGPFISDGSEIEVVEISGNRVIVRQT